MTMLRRSVFSATLLVAMAHALQAQAPLPTGLTPRLASRFDPELSYAVYLPSTYRPEARWPIVLIMDYRGRALMPLERMIPAAERWGYILMSSYDTSSDVDVDPNDRAVDAMIEDAQELFAVDPRRLYFAGFSGTARKSWELGDRFTPYTAGIIGLGAGLPHPTHLVTATMTQPIGFAYFGGAGDLDFNYEEMRSLDRALDAYGIPHHLDYYEGVHEWPDSSVLGTALEWMELQAVRTGLRTRSRQDVDELYGRGVARAERLEARDDLEGAARTYSALLRDFDGLTDTRIARRRFDRLWESERVQAATRRIERQIAERRAFDQKLLQWLSGVRESGTEEAVEAGFAALDVRGLQRRAASSDVADAKAARRMLEEIFTISSFYLPAEFDAKGVYAVSGAFYRLAVTIKPNDGAVCLGLARSSARLGATGIAVDALECAVASGTVTADILELDPALATLHGDPRFLRLVRRLGG